MSADEPLARGEVSPLSAETQHKHKCEAVSNLGLVQWCNALELNCLRLVCYKCRTKTYHNCLFW